METIKNYLETMFSNLPLSEEVRRAKEELLTMMEDKYYELKKEGKTENEAIGTVIREFGNLDELKESLGITNEFEEKENTRFVSIETVEEYIQVAIKMSKRIALGVFLCICSPVLLIVLGGLAEYGFGDENSMALGGLIVLLVFVAVAVVLFIFSGMKLEKYNYLKNERFQIDFSTKQYVLKEKEAYRSTQTLFVAIGVALCILSVIPILVTGVLFEKIEFLTVIGVGVFLILVAIGVTLFIISGSRMESYKVILQEEEFTQEKKEMKENKLVQTVAGIYWPVIVCIYLGWSFLTFDWHITWIIWPLAGILFGAITVICNIVDEKHKIKG